MTPDDLTCGEPLDARAFAALARRAVLECAKWNIADDGRTTLCDFPLVLSPALASRLARWAERLDEEARDAEAELLARPELFARLGLPFRVRLALARARPSTACRYARFDFHPLGGDGFAITEGNVDVAGGWNEASGVTRLFAEHARAASPGGDPADALGRAIAAAGDVVGCMHATQFADDHQVVRFVAKHLGSRVVLFGPSQLVWRGRRACARVGSRLFSFDAVFRFFPADWLPRLDIASSWWRIFAPGATRWVNPASTILTQSKRFPLVWRDLRAPLATWKRLMPETRCPRDADGRGWVLKPALAHEGHKVAIDGVTATYDAIRRAARRAPRAWAAQRRFAAAPLRTPRGPRYPCVGVYVVEGRAAGFYGRLAERPLVDHHARDVVVLVRE
jgi:hypothetical protein